MIVLYDPSSEDFSNNGVCVLQPTVCEIEEEAGGMFELHMTHPITDDMRANVIQRGMLIKAPVPARETPLIQISAEGHEEQAEHDIWRVKVSTSSLWSQPKSLYPSYNSSTSYSPGAKVSYNGRSYQATAYTSGIAPTGVGLKQISSPTSTLKKLILNDEVVYIAEYSSTWSQVTEKTGMTGYMKNADIEYLRTEPYVPTLPSYQTVVPSRKIRDQLFRIYNIETDSKNREVYVDARHIFYDLLGNVIKDYNAVDQNPQDVLNAISLDLCNEHGFNFYTNLTGTISSECALKSAVDVLLDLDTGIVPLKNAQLIRDNFDVFILQNTEIDRGMRIEYGKNMLGIKVTEDQSNVITRIIPIGKTIDSSKLKLPEVYVDSANVVNYPTPYAKAFTYDDVQVKAATETEPEVTEAQAYELLRGKVAEEYAKHCDLPEIDVDVEYVHLGDTEEYAAFKELQKVFLYDTVSAKYNPMGMEFSMQIIGYVYDAILQRFKKTKIANKLYKKNTTAFWSM